MVPAQQPDSSLQQTFPFIAGFLFFLAFSFGSLKAPSGTLLHYPNTPGLSNRADCSSLKGLTTLLHPVRREAEHCIIGYVVDQESWSLGDDRTEASTPRHYRQSEVTLGLEQISLCGSRMRRSWWWWQWWWGRAVVSSWTRSHQW